MLRLVNEMLLQGTANEEFSRECHTYTRTCIAFTIISELGIKFGDSRHSQAYYLIRV